MSKTNLPSKIEVADLVLTARQAEIIVKMAMKETTIWADVSGTSISKSLCKALDAKGLVSYARSYRGEMSAFVSLKGKQVAGMLLLAAKLAETHKES